jgi:hypothetical protein
MAKVVRGLVKAAVLAKVIDVARRELAKPENQRRAKELVERAASRVGRQR